jgi:segregation and condensation protein B
MNRIQQIESNDDDDGDLENVAENGLSLEELGQTYAKLLTQGEVPYVDESTEDEQPVPEAEFDPVLEETIADDQCPVTPTSIVEAMLFVGHPDNHSISSEDIASLMRGVRPAEIDEAVVELNAKLAAFGHAFEIASINGGYRLQLRQELGDIRERIHGKMKESRLNQAAIDCLALIAYQPGISKEELELQWNRSPSSVLGMLIQRNLVELKRDPDAPKATNARYYPTERLLNLLGVASLDELPQVEDFA